MKRSEVKAGVEAITRTRSGGDLCVVVEDTLYTKVDRWARRSGGSAYIPLPADSRKGAYAHVRKVPSYRVRTLAEYDALGPKDWNEAYVILNQLDSMPEGHRAYVSRAEANRAEDAERQAQRQQEWDEMITRLRGYTTEMGVDLGYVLSSPDYGTAVPYRTVLQLLDAAKATWGAGAMKVAEGASTPNHTKSSF